MDSSQKRVVVGFVIAILVLSVLTLSSYRSIYLLISTRNWVTHTQEVLRRLNRLQADVAEAESNTRGYAITGDRLYLEHYAATADSAAATEKLIRQLTSDNAAQQRRLDALEPTIAERFAAMREVLDSRRNGDADQVVQLVRTRGEPLGGEIRKRTEEMKEEETRLLAERSEASEVSAHQTLGTLLLGTLLSFALLSLVFYLLNRDITEHKRMGEMLQQLSLTDELTGLYNRRGFIALAEQQLKFVRSKRMENDLSLFYADMDGLKQINDQFGHEAGSQAIVKVAEVLKQTFRETDIIARIGGDEFTILTVDVSPDEEHAVKARLQENIRRRNETGDSPHPLSLSVGMAQADEVGVTSVEELLARADQAMYAQKRVKQKSKRSSSSGEASAIQAQDDSLGLGE